MSGIFLKMSGIIDPRILHFRSSVQDLGYRSIVLQFNWVKHRVCGQPFPSFICFLQKMIKGQDN